MKMGTEFWVEHVAAAGLETIPASEYGDAVTPAPEVVEYPVMRDEFPAPRLRVYPRYTVVAEKLEAMITLGVANSRLSASMTLR